MHVSAWAAGVTWLLFLHKQGGFVCCSGAVSHTVILSALCMQCCAGSTLRVWLMGLTRFFFMLMRKRLHEQEL